jgi:hypothetical protein
MTVKTFFDDLNNNDIPGHNPPINRKYGTLRGINQKRPVDVV